MDHPEGPTLSEILIQRIVSITQNALSALLQHRISSSGLLLTKSLAGR